MMWHWNSLYGATRLCFSILYVIITNNYHVVIILLVIIPSFLKYCLSQGSVSVILTLVYPCSGICKMKARIFAYPTFYTVFDIGLPWFMSWMNTCMYTCIILVYWPECMRTCFFMRGSVWHIGKFRLLRFFRWIGVF